MYIINYVSVIHLWRKIQLQIVHILHFNIFNKVVLMLLLLLVLFEFT